MNLESNYRNLAASIIIANRYDADFLGSEWCCELKAMCGIENVQLKPATKVQARIPTEDERLEMVRLYEEGMISKDIAKKFGVTRVSVLNYVRRKKAALLEADCSNVSMDKRLEIVRRYMTESRTAPQLAYEYGLKIATVEGYVSRYRMMFTDTERQDTKGMSEYDKKDVVTRFMNGESSQKLAREYQISPSSVCNWVKKYMGREALQDRELMRFREKYLRKKNNDRSQNDLP